jgi:HSP20 family protein
MSRTTISRRPSFFTAFTAPPVLKTSPLRDLSPSLEQLNARANELFRATFGEMPELTAEQFPALNVSEDKNEFTVTAELPGMSMKDITVDYCDGVLTIQGQKEHEESKGDKGKNYYVWERRFGSFQRALPIPGGIAEDQLTADYKDGLLTVHLPKNEESKSKRRTVPIAEK